MSIAGLSPEGKAEVGRISADWVIVLIILLASSAAFGLGYVAGKDTAAKEELRIEGADLSASAALSGTEKNYVASKTGKSYHLPSCSGAKLIKEENKVWFATKEDAEALGYVPAGNCPGI